MILNLISRDTVKTQLGIDLVDTTYDASITAMIPIVSRDVRRILNTEYDCYTSLTITDTESSFSGPMGLFKMGQVLYGEDIPDDTYVTVYNPVTSIYTISAAVTADVSYVYPTLEIAQWPTVSKMIFYKIGKQTTDSATQEKLKQISYGNVSKEFADSEINSKYDYPQTYIDDLGTPYARTN